MTNDILIDRLSESMARRTASLPAAMLCEGGRRVASSADETQGDFLIDDSISLEIGGASKKRKASHFVIRDDTDYPSGNSLPLWSLGFLY